MQLWMNEKIQTGSYEKKTNPKLEDRILNSGKQRIRERRSICMTPVRSSVNASGFSLVYNSFHCSPFTPTHMHIPSITCVSTNSNFGSSEGTNSVLPCICEHICFKLFCFVLPPGHREHLRTQSKSNTAVLSAQSHLKQLRKSFHLLRRLPLVLQNLLYYPSRNFGAHKNQPFPRTASHEKEL